MILVVTLFDLIKPVKVNIFTILTRVISMCGMLSRLLSDISSRLLGLRYGEISSCRCHRFGWQSCIEAISFG